MILQLLEFAGMAPRWHPRALRDGLAQQAVLTRFDRRTLAPYRNVEPVFEVAKLGTMQTIYRWGQDLNSDSQYWFHWDVPVSVIRTPVPDTAERTYYFGDGEPKFTDETLYSAGGGTAYPTSYRLLGLPRPAAPSVTKSGTPTDTTLADRRFYQYTYVTTDGREGPPSEPSPAIDVFPGETVTVTMAAAPAGQYDIDASATKRLYRTSSGASSTAFLLVDDTISIDDVTYDDVLLANELGNPIGTDTWDPPPTDLAGAVLLPNGIIMGWRENELWMCEPFVPHAWPAEYMLSVDSKIVGVGVSGMTAVVCTQGAPYLVTGVHPSAMTMEQLDLPQACMSRRSIVSVPGGVLYASPDGLVFVNGRQGEIITRDLYRREEWQRLQPATMHCAVHESKLYCFHEGLDGSGGLLFDFFGEMQSVVDLGVHFSAAYTDPKRDSLYLCGTEDLAGDSLAGQYVTLWDGGATEMPYVWHSKVFVLPSRKTLTAAKVIADDYPVTFSLYTDGNLRMTKTVNSRAAFRLPSGYECEEVEVSLAGTAKINAVYLAETMDELRMT